MDNTLQITMRLKDEATDQLKRTLGILILSSKIRNQKAFEIFFLLFLQFSLLQLPYLKKKIFW